jgi:poly [ADP-ribose] polymerase
MRWGRVGNKGQTSTTQCGADLNKAKDIFEKKFLDKTKNYWSEKDSFEKYTGKYDLVEKDYEETSSSNDANDLKKDTPNTPTLPKKEIPESKLDKKIQDLIQLICNVSEMENVLKEMSYDAKKAPLGKLSKSQIKLGYAALKQIEDLIGAGKQNSGQAIIAANNDFYTRIPHNFGMKPPPILRTRQVIQEKMRLLELLEDIEVAVKALNQKSEIDNPVDRHYDQLECRLNVLDHSDKMFKVIEDYVTRTHAPTHNNFKLKLLDVFEAGKESEAKSFKDVGNRMLLWHGSRLTNWAGILSQGLRIAPPEAPVTGYMFGKGCYFADCSSKSANYCYATSGKNEALLSLSEVSLGVCNELKQADNDANKLPKGTASTKGLGRSSPDKSQWVTLDDGCVVPCGQMKSSVSKDVANSCALLYNEYIVYDVAQIKLKYLVKVKFDFDVYDDDDDDE